MPFVAYEKRCASSKCLPLKTSWPDIQEPAEDEEEEGDEGRPEIEGKTAKEMIESAGVFLKGSDPFAAASFAAKTELQRTKALEKQRAKVAKIREQTIYQRARAKRAKEAYSKHMKHLQAKELGRAIMMQEMAMTIEEKAKRSVARDMRLKSAMRRQTNPYKHNGTKSLPGPVIGPGPISAAAIDTRGELRYAFKKCYEASNKSIFKPRSSSAN